MIIYPDSDSYVCIEHVAATSFTGVELGRASYTHGASNSAVTFRARQLGADGNALKVVLQAPGYGVVETTVAKFESDTLTVTLRRNAGGILATAIEVAAVVNSIPTSRRCPIVAMFGGNGSGVVTTLSSTPLAGGADPSKNVNNCFYTWAGPNSGLINFQQERGFVINQVHARLGASVAWTLSVVNLDPGLGPVSGESVVVAASTSQDVAYTGSLVLMPRQALQLAAATTGIVRAVGRLEPLNR